MNGFKGAEYKKMPAIEHGTTYSLLFTFTDDITGWSFSANLISPDGKTLHKSFMINIDLVNKRVRCTIPKSETPSIPSGVQKFEFVVTDATDETYVWVTGKVDVNYRKPD